MVHVRLDHPGNVPRTSAAEASRDGDVLSSTDTERYRKALHRRAESNLPENLPGVHVQGSEVAIQIADKGQTAAG